MFLEHRFERFIDHLRQSAPIPLRFELWNGRAFDLASHPIVKVSLPKPSALRFLVAPTLLKLGEAYVEGHIRVEGSMMDVFRAAESLAKVAADKGRSGLRLFTRHSRQRDRRAIEYHYDVSDDFYSLFLDRSMVYSCAYYRSESD